MPALLVLVASLVLAGLPATAVGQQQRRTPSADELWRSYPLHEGASRPARPSNASRAVAPTRRDAAPEQPADGSPAAEVLVVLGLAAGVVTLAWARRRRASRSDATAPAHSSPAPDAAGAETRAARGAAPPARVSGSWLPPDPARVWSARIEWGHAGAESRFRVLAEPDEGSERAEIARSVALEWPPAGPAGVQALTDAAEDLEAFLVDAGWRALPPGDAWYAKRFGWEPIGDTAGIAASAHESGSSPGDGAPPAHAVPVAIDAKARP